MALAALLLLPLAVSMRAGVRLLRCSASSRGPASRAHVGLPKGVEWGRQYHRPASGAASGLPPQDKPFTVLGIETSCDDTGVAVVRSDGTILGEALASQAALHEEFGGVMPGVARDAHAEALDRVTAEALKRAGLASVADVDAVAVVGAPPAWRRRQ